MPETESTTPYLEHDPLTEWSNEPTILDLKADYQEASNHHDMHVTQVNAWLDNLNVTNAAKPKKIEGRSSIQPKLIRKQAEWRYASLSEAFLSQEHLFDTHPVTFEDQEAALQNGLVLNHQFNNLIDKVSFIDEYVRTAVDEGTVIVRVGWEFEEEEVEVPNMVPQPIRDPRLLQMIEEVSQMMLQQNPQLESVPPQMIQMVQMSMQAGQPIQMVQDGTKMEMQTVRNQPVLEVCDFTQVIIDPTCKGNLKKASFVIYSFETSKSDLEKAGLYENLDKINVETNSITNATNLHAEDTSGFNFKDPARKKFIAYEYWGYWDIDGSGKTQPIVATWVGDTIIRMDESPFPDEGLPFVKVQYLPKRKNVYGEPDGELLTENQKIAGAVTRGMVDIMGRAAVGQMGVRKDALDVTNQRKFDSGLDYSFNAHVDPRSAFHHHVYPELPQSAPFMLQLQNNEAESMSGIKAFSGGGITGEGLGESATAAKSALGAAGLRELGILRRLAKGIVEVGYKISAMNSLFLNEEEVVRITNEEFVTVKRDDLSGRVDIKLEISTAETDDIKAQELAFMLQTVGNTLPPDFSIMILTDIARLRRMPELAKRLETYEPQPDPMAEQMQQLELAKLQAEIEKIKSEAAENMAEAGLDSAKARQTNSEADRTDLDFVEQESGQHHSRELEKQGAQAQGNKELEVVKALLNPKGGNSE